MRDDTHPTSASEPAALADPDEASLDPAQAELSRAAREAVRQPADPRIDRQLARMGLAPTDEDAAVSGLTDRQVPRPVRADEVEGIRAAQTATQSGLDRVTRRLDLLTWVVTIEGISIAILALLLLLR